jgi:plasmid stabilization system protein ParE
LRISCSKNFATLPIGPVAVGYARSLPGPHFRFWPIEDYFIIYLAEIEPLTIVRILHTSRDLTAILNRYLIPASHD